MKIEVPAEIPDKKLNKLIQKYNKFLKKGKQDKSDDLLKEIIKQLVSILKEEPQDANIYLYTLSLIAENDPLIINKESFDVLSKYINTEHPVKEEINAIAIQGFYLLKLFETEEPEDYDFVIIDESSQVDLATGALALSCAKRAVIVGDLKQLPNVVDDKMIFQHLSGFF